MTDIGTGDYGYIHPQAIPEPDSPLTMAWGSLMAKGVARITGVGETNLFTFSAVNYFGTFVFGNRDHNGVPLLKVYHMILSGEEAGYTDYRAAGTCNSVDKGTNACVDIAFEINDGPADKIYVQYGSFEGLPASGRNDFFNFQGYGR